MGLLLERNEGAASLCQWDRSPLGRGFLLECSFVLEAKGPKSLELNRFLPIECKEVVLTHQGSKPSCALSYRSNSQLLREIKLERGSDVYVTLERILPPLAERAQQAAEAWGQALITEAIQKAEREYIEESERLRYLVQVNPAVSVDELFALEQRFQQIIALISETSVRLDGVRGIFTH
jgi:ATP-dependent helicase HepA